MTVIEAKKSKHIKEEVIVRYSFRKLKHVPLVDVCCEVPILGRVVDLAYVRKGTLFTIEFKIHNWRQAITQARDHLLAADYSYICMPKRKISRELLFELERAGIGLMFYSEKANWPFEKVVPARRSQETWDVARSRTLLYIASNKGKSLWRKIRNQ